MNQKFAAHDSQGHITAYYDSIDSPVPEGVTNIIEITHDEWQACLNQPGYAVTNGTLVAPLPPTEAQLLKQAQAGLSNKVNAACANALVGGFTSSALGGAHAYPSQDDDQRNLQNAVSAAAIAPSNWTTPIWCASNDAWSFAPHTAAQVQQVNADWLAYRVAAQQKYAGLIAKINAATSIEEVQAIDW
ncbi:hypothetical protein [Ralstonia flaminis]|jgi:hypothetical protein|uniref:DUF4376 domain-containing protein n=1 Tax=Ralstonia flaminis TaxID=3058597 RepID=A0ABM9K022_9RALS|nr:hypothetical protein [Ralstonia sp. LMG 18101]CAJ0809235.1 hypothetical protein LMG18101_00528 [Ralstonia sp. LMG 18101]